MESWMGWLVLICWHLFLFHFSFSHSICHPHDSFALLQFKASFPINTAYYYAYGCPDTINPNMETWENGTNCCSWLGVTCHPISGHVTGLDLSCNGLQGKIHPNSTLFGLSHLQSLNLASNNFSNSQFSSLFMGFTCLRHLNLSDSNFVGEIPSKISHLSKLESLDLSYNSELKWKESTWKRLLQNTTVLRELVLDYTNMSSTSMRPLNLSSSLVTLSLESTGIRGKLPDDILCLPNLQQLGLSSNDFEGSILPSFSSLTHLNSLDLSFNNLHGSIPSSLLTHPHLTSLHIDGNDLSGQIPNVFHHSNRFEELNLAGNNFGGELPSTLSNLQHLIHLDLSWNKLEGPLPDKITGFSNLTKLWLNNNLLNGTIPSWCLSLPSLLDLDLSDNQFTGQVTAISSYSLQDLDLSYNKLQGDIPESIFTLVNLTFLWLSSNNFTGDVNFALFSNPQKLRFIGLSRNSQLSLNLNSIVNHSFSSLVRLSLSSMGLTEFPKLLREFPMLQILDLSSNKFEGRVPNWLCEMNSLKILNLSHNLFTSMDHFPGNDNLVYLNLGFNSLTGGISSSICNASSLQTLKLSHNKLSGIIPQCLENLSYLGLLDLQMNKLSGTLPSTFSKNNRLTILDLNGNQLQGLLPESLSNCSQLEILNLGNNQIEDKFPHWLYRLSELKVLVLRDNKFHGPIATLKTKSILPNLIIFDISSNNFSGTLPIAYIENFKPMKESIGKESSFQYMHFYYTISLNGTWVRYGLYDSMFATMKGINMMLTRIPTVFTIIDLSGNKFEGEIPNVLGELRGLIGLNLSHNKLIGPIPQSMGNLTNLESLDLSSNMLTGRIPLKLTNLNSLEVLNLSYNHLVGEIPQGKQFNTFSSDSYEGNLGLCGSPLSIKCNVNPEEHPPYLQTFGGEQKFGFSWKPVAMGYGCGMIFGVGLECCVLLIGKPIWVVRIIGGEQNRRVLNRTRIMTQQRMNQLVQM